MATYSVQAGGQVLAHEVNDEAWRFWTTCAADPEKMAALDREGSYDALAELARSWGYSATANELREYATVVEAAYEARLQADDLTDDELDLVAGGASAGTGGTVKPFCSGGTTCKTCCSTGISKCSTCTCPKACL